MSGFGKYLCVAIMITVTGLTIYGGGPLPTAPLPVASFTATPTGPVAGQAVQFTDTSTGNPTGWLWNFGDGTTSTLRNPSHGFAVAGNYNVTLKVSNNLSSSVTSRIIRVKPLPVAEFDFTPVDPRAGQAVNFNDRSTGNPTSWEWDFGDKSTSSLRSPNHTYTTAGSYTVKLKVSVGAFNSTKSQTLVVATDSPAFNMEQTLSDGAQRTTLAFSGLGMMTGNLEAQSFFPPGKVADYTGFQYLRDNDPDKMGHNTSFLTRIANNVILILNDNQFARLRDLAISQQALIDLYGYRRYPLMKAFRRLIDNDLPAGATGLNLNAVKKASRELYLIDGQISYDRAVLYAAILNSLDSNQRAYLEAMKGRGWSSWPEVSQSMIDSRMKSLPRGTSVAVMTYAGDLFSWYAGSIEADVYFCPERQGTYYGSFYIKDAPAIGHEGYSIDEQLTATAGRALSESSAGYVNAEQAALVGSLVDLQRDNLYGSSNWSILKMRTDIATLLRGLLTTGPSAEIRDRVLELSGIYGELDGENNYYYATVFGRVYASLTVEQKAKLMTLRKSIMSGTYADGTPFDFTICTTPFLYSSLITDQKLLIPYTGNTDYLFREP